MVFKNNDGGVIILGYDALYCIEHMHRLGFTVCKKPSLSFEKYEVLYNNVLPFFSFFLLLYFRFFKDD